MSGGNFPLSRANVSACFEVSSVCVAVNHYQKFQNIFPEASRVQNKFYLNAPVGGEFVEYEQIDTSHIRKNQSKQWFAYK